MSFYLLVFSFFCYSFIGWVLETLVAAVREKRYVDRSVLFGPFCAIYGVAGTLITVGLSELTESWVFLLIGSVVLATVVEWVAGHLLERITHTRWWDYSGRRWNLDGYICVSASLLWGGLGVALVKWGSPLLTALFGLIPPLISQISLWVLLGIFLFDVCATALTLTGRIHKMPRVDAIGSQLDGLSMRMGQWLVGTAERRIQKAHPGAEFVRHERKAKSTIFAYGCGFYKLFLLFFVGAFLGDITEMIFCRITAGVWMSRSSVVWGPFSIVWGLAMALATALLYQYRDRSASFLFVAGSLLGGVYEYLCSVFTELVFGTVFWDYSDIPFNLGGRVNLLFCFFWGFAAVAWFRGIYPHVSGWIERIPMRVGKIMVLLLAIFMVCNMALSCVALARYSGRADGVPARNAVEEYVDVHFDDAKMDRIYPNAKHEGSARAGA